MNHETNPLGISFLIWFLFIIFSLLVFGIKPSELISIKFLISYGLLFIIILHIISSESDKYEKNYADLENKSSSRIFKLERENSMLRKLYHELYLFSDSHITFKDDFYQLLKNHQDERNKLQE